jgi:2-iminobutanoate/2-iminopropanoate deaminase
VHALPPLAKGRQSGVKTAVFAADGPKAIGAYSPAVRSGQLLFLSGQIPFDPATGVLVSGGIAVETERVLKNVGALLLAAGLGFQDVVRTTVFLTDMADFAAMNDVYGRYFTEPFPARSTVQVARLPRDVRIEIDAIASFDAR